MLTRGLLSLGVVAGLVVAAVCSYFSLVDWRELTRAYQAFAAVSRHGEMKSIFVAEAQQNIHRINLFADVVWALLGAILSVISAIGLKSSAKADKQRPGAGGAGRHLHRRKKSWVYRPVIF